MIFFPENLIQLKMNCVLPLNLFHPFLLPNLHKYLFKILFYPPEPTFPPSVLQLCACPAQLSRRRRDECYCLERNVSPGSIDTRQTELTPFYFTRNFKFIFFTMWNISEQKMNNFVGAGNMKYEIC